MTTQDAVVSKVVLECIARRLGNPQQDRPHGTQVTGLGRSVHFKPLDPTDPAGSPHVCEFAVVKDAKVIARLLQISEMYRHYNPDLIEAERVEFEANAGDPMAKAADADVQANVTEKVDVPAYEGDLPPDFEIMSKKDMIVWAEKAIPTLALNAKWPAGRVGQLIRDSHRAGHPA